jgi:cytochrome P450
MSFFPLIDLSDFFFSLSSEVREGLFSKLPDRREVALSRLRETLPTSFDLEYIEHAILPALVTSAFQGERLALPLIDETQFSKENALPYFLWGMLYDSWEPNLDADGLSVFIQGYANRGADNHRKKIYASALTPDLYRSMYTAKVVKFFNQLFDPKRANQPLMRQYLDSYFDLYWDLHLGVTGDAIPADVRQIGESFNTALAYINPIKDIVHDNYVRVRALRPFLKDWINKRVEDVAQQRVPHPEQTFVYYWLKNGAEGADFRRKDIVFECFHNFVALSQWGNTIYNIMHRLSVNTGNAEVQAWFHRTMSSDFDQVTEGVFTPLDRFVMELFRTISPNAGSISVLQETGTLTAIYPRYGYIVSPHKSTSEASEHWSNPTSFDPDRYLQAPTSDQIDEVRSRQLGFAQCPFHKQDLKVNDGRDAILTNSAFGTVYGVTEDQPYPVCDYAGYAPFGFGYRRCPGELLTVELFKDFFRKVWQDQIKFQQLSLPNPAEVPVGPTTVVPDNIGFTR